MHLRRLFIEDFGCYRHQQLRQLAPGLVVVAGPQRAGKTTLLRVLRHLGFGFRKRFDLPPPAVEYRVEAELVHGGQRYALRLKGYGQPQLEPLDGAGPQDVGELYANLTRFAYHQLFTLSLDELHRLPRSLGDHGERDLQTVLLGAGWADAVRIPQLKRQLDGEAQQLGGKYGRAARFRELLNSIQTAMAARDEALEQVEAFGRCRRRLEQLAETITAREARLKALEERRQVLRLAGEHLPQLAEYRRLQAVLDQEESRRLLDGYPAGGATRAEELEAAYAEARQELAGARQRLAGRVGADAEDRLDALLEARDELREASRQVAGWRERLRSLAERETRLERDHASLRREAAELNEAWADDLSRLAAVRTGLISQDQLRRHVETHRELSQRLAANQEKQEDLGRRLAACEARREALPKGGLAVQVGLTLAGLLAILAAGHFLGESWEEIGAWAVAGVVGLAWLLLRWPQLKVAVASQEEAASLDRERANITTERERLRQEEALLKEDRSWAAAGLDEVRQALQLPAALSADGVEGFYREAVRLRGQLQALRQEEESLARDWAELEEELTAPGRLLAAVGREPAGEEGDLRRRVDRVAAGLEAARADLEAARDVTAAQRRLDRCTERIAALLAQEEGAAAYGEAAADLEALHRQLAAFRERGERRDQLQEAKSRAETLAGSLLQVLKSENNVRVLAPFRPDPAGAGDDSWVLAALERAAGELNGEEAVDDERARVEQELAAERAALDADLRQRGQLEDELERLRTDRALRAAQEAIDEGRQELELVAEEYALRRIAAWLLDRLHQRFVEKAHGPLLDRAGSIFTRITGGEYGGLQPPDDLARVDYAALRGEDGRLEPSGAMSGGTREQLFLAVRLARIGEIEPPLPVILDDSAANFDPAHRRRTLGVLDELAGTHQIFVLTCHPELVQLVAGSGRPVQYWGLEAGVFAGPYDDPNEPLKLLQAEA